MKVLSAEQVFTIMIKQEQNQLSRNNNGLKTTIDKNKKLSKSTIERIKNGLERTIILKQHLV